MKFEPYLKINNDNFNDIMHLFKFKDNNEFIKLFNLEDVRLIRYAQVDLELNIINKAEYEEIKQNI
jgi:hypothetical protein